MQLKFSQLFSQLEFQKLTVNFSVNFSQLAFGNYPVSFWILRNCKVNLTRKKPLVD